MQARHIWSICYGFALAAVLAFGPPIAFLMIPGAGFFALLLPIWSAGIVGLLFLGFLIFGRIYHLLGVTLLGIAAAVSPLGNVTLLTANVVSQFVETSKIVSDITNKCATGLSPVQTASSKYSLIILDSVEMNGEQNYDIADTLAVLTGMRVVVVERFGLDRHFDNAWETKAVHSGACSGERNSAVAGISPRGSQRKIAPLAVDMCLLRTKIPDPSRAQTPAIILRDSKSDSGPCSGTEVIERTFGGEANLGRVIHDPFHGSTYPELPPPEGVPKNNWLTVLLSKVLQQDLSDKALLKHAVMSKK